MPTISQISAAEIAAGLPRGRKSGSGYVACCPAHDDRSPSLSLRDGDGGTVLVHCHSGCSQVSVIAALRDLGLWPEQPRRWLSDAEFAAQRRAAREQEQEDAAWLPSMRDFLRELQLRRDELIRLLRIRDDFHLEIELEVTYMRIESMRKAIGHDVTDEAVELTLAIVDLIAEAN